MDYIRIPIPTSVGFQSRVLCPLSTSLKLNPLLSYCKGLRPDELQATVFSEVKGYVCHSHLIVHFIIAVGVVEIENICLADIPFVRIHIPLPWT